MTVKKGWKQTLDFGFITDLYILPKKCLSESRNSTLNCFLGIPAASTTTTHIENCQQAIYKFTDVVCKKLQIPSWNLREDL